MATKMSCPITRAAFKAAAKPLRVDLAGMAIMALPKDFTTGSYGYYAGGKVKLDVGGVPVTFQASVNLTAVGSKESVEA